MAKKSASAAKAAKTPHLIVSKPISVLQRDLKADAGGLFKALGKSIVHLGTGKTWELASDVGEAAAALGLKTDPGGLAWYLIRRSLLRAMHALVDEAWLHREAGTSPPPEELEDQLDKEIAKTTLEVSPAFFRQPGHLSFVEPCSKWFEIWLKGIGFEQPKATSIASRLRSYFVYALNQEWRTHPDLYAPIVTASTTPFTQAGEREWAWEQYRAWLDQELDSPMFGEPFSLRQLYVPLRAYYQRAPVSLHEAPTERGDDGKRKRLALDLTPSLIEWVKRNDREDAVRIVSGGPGSGKSSVAKMLTAEIHAQTTWKALYVPLHRIQYKGDIVPAIDDYLKRTGLLAGTHGPFDHENGDPKLLIIFDGLDELAMLGKIAQENANGFVRAMKDLVRDQNTTSLRLKIILTGRTVVMQSLESEFRCEGAVLHLCPYFVDEGDKEYYESGWKLLAQNDQRQLWWKRYGELTGRGYKSLPEHFDRKDLVEVSSEPLLNYLLALADQTKALDFTKQVTQNQIYASLIHEVYERRWAGGENFAVRGMSEDHFQRVLEEVAVAAWHGDGRKTTVGEIKQHCHEAGITKMIETFQDGAESGVLRLLTAFFFRQAGVRDDENAFEFTHKSFGEYLVVRRIVRMIAIMKRKADEQQREFTGWDERKCLEEWTRLCGPTPMTARQWEFLKSEMHRNEAQPTLWQALLISLINALLRQGMPMEKLGLKDFQTMHSQSRNAEEVLLVALNSCALFTNVVSEVQWPERSSAGAWIKRLQEQRLGGKNVLAMNCMSLLSFHFQCLDMADFYAADLSGSVFNEVNLYFACLCNTDLSNAKLSNVAFSWANLRGANLNGAVLTKPDFSEAVLNGANLVNTDLRGARLHGANLEGAKLEGANLEGANLKGANLKGANLKGANLKEANLEGANLEGANLKGANLKEANLKEANLKEANLKEANLKGAKSPPARLNLNPAIPA